MQEPQVVPIRAQPDPQQERALLDKTRQIAIKYLAVLLQRMFDNADDALFELADKSVSNQEQTAYFDAMRELRRMRQGLEFGFKHHLNDHFDRFTQNPKGAHIAKSRTQLLEDESLSLIDQVDLEESLATHWNDRQNLRIAIPITLTPWNSVFRPSCMSTSSP